MVCHVIIPPLTLSLFSSSFTSLSHFQNGDSLQLFWCGEKLPSVHVSLNRIFSFPSPFFALLVLCFRSAFSYHLFLLSPHEIFCPIRASSLNKSNLSCWKRKYWKLLMYFMVISCGRGGGEQQRVTAVEEEEVMVLRHLYSLPQTVTTSNGTIEGQKGGTEVACRDWSPDKTPGVGEKNDQNCLKSSLSTIYCSNKSLAVGILQGVEQDLSCKTTPSFSVYCHGG